MGLRGEQDIDVDSTVAGATASRRAVVTGGVKLAGTAGLAMAAASATSLGVRRTFAQDATPGATPASNTSTIGGVSVDPQMQEVLDALTSFNAPPIESTTPFNARNLPAFSNAVQQVLADRGEPALEPIGGVEHILVPGAEGDIVVRVYRPAQADDGPLPLLVYFHGGGFVIANLDVYDAAPRALANAAGCIVASVAYRLAPEAPFPCPVDDAYAATQFLFANAATIGADPARIAVGGESAGGNLATVVSILARDQGGIAPLHQLLVYPVATFAPAGEAAESVTQFGDARPLNAAALQWFGSYYLPDPALAADPSVSPLDSADLAGLPPATIILAEIDPLQSQGRLYGEALQAAGVEATVTLYEGVTHEFFGMGAVVDKAADAVAEAAEALQAAFDGGVATPTA